MNLLQLTVRMDSAMHEHLKLMSKATKTSMNQLALEGIEMELQLLSVEYEWNAAKTLKRLERYRRHDPRFGKAIRAFSQAEVEHDDPLEGEPFLSDPSSELQRRLRELLDGS